MNNEQTISNEHVDNNLAVRKMLIERGVKPETLPPAEDVNKVKRRLESDEKKALKLNEKEKVNKFAAAFTPYQMRINFLLILVLALHSCGTAQEKKTSYPNHVGDIEFDTKVDDPNFKVCDETRVYQYYNFGKGLQYKGEKIKITEHFAEKFQPADRKGETGFITIRFIVSCEGNTGRFRIQEMDADYNAKKFNKELVSQLLKLTKELNGWIAGGDENHKVDYYQYLTFKIVDGKLIEIMP